VYTIVLAGSSKEANDYARVASLPRGRFRYATQASSIRGLRVAEIHELPGFARRADRHALNSVLRYTKGERIEISHEEFTDLKAAHQQRQTAYSLERAAMIAHRYESIKEASRGEETRTPEPSEGPAPAPEVDDLFKNPTPRAPRKRAAAKPAAPKPAPAPKPEPGEFF